MFEQFPMAAAIPSAITGGLKPGALTTQSHGSPGPFGSAMMPFLSGHGHQVELLKRLKPYHGRQPFANITKSWPCPPVSGSQSIDWLEFGLDVSMSQLSLFVLFLQCGARSTRRWPT